MAYENTNWFLLNIFPIGFLEEFYHMIIKED
jgi:hypothetical protein